MGTLELKSDLLRILDNIEDEQLLRAVYDFLNRVKELKWDKYGRH